MIKESQINPPEGQLKNEKNINDYELIKKKYLISRFATGERLGAQNIYQAAINLYAALYDQDGVDELIDKSEKFPERIDIMKTAVGGSPKRIPDKEEFIAEIRRVLTRGVNYEEAVSEESKKQLFDIMRKCVHTVIWTDGDTLGVPEKGLPGSREQLYKMGSTKFYNKMRQEIAKEKNQERGEVMSVISVEGKMKRVLDIVEKFLKMGIENVIIIEDRIKNIEDARQIILENSTLNVLSVLVQKDNSISEIEDQDVHVINKFSEAGKILEDSIDFVKKVGAIIDLDGVISDDEVRRDLQADALIKSFQEKGWIK
jgi:hypothetical protein